ncbi:MAG TPA: hypothetical protein PKK18_08455 [Chitinophagales bacterium]|nr:hypothetical protein [Chitinophagales bacterium]HMW13309.1 hypothetical protein [Chitinophagales bacterium]HMX60484.1 hypothetical protein [Chitinophagales bacterium]HMY22401.1 hypothetical protein [Chitinophagales bacterium]HMZ33322.1 hypothetical protein [Chitinophagales bacterium]
MKKISTNICIVLSIALFFVACKKDDNGKVRKQHISLMADGVAFSVTTDGVDVEEADAHIRDGNKFQLDATTSTKDFSINNKNVPSTGNYVMNGAGTVFDFAQWEDGPALFSSLGSPKSHFTFNISNIAGSPSDYVRYVEGTFSGVLYNNTQTDSVIITNGQIHIID